MRPCSYPSPYPTPPPWPSPPPHPTQTTTPALVLLPLDGCLANHNGQRSFTLSLNWMCLNLLQISSIEVEQHGYPLNLLQILTTITNLPTLRNKSSIMCAHRPLVVTALSSNSNLWHIILLSNLITYTPPHSYSITRNRSSLCVAWVPCRDYAIW